MGGAPCKLQFLDDEAVAEGGPEAEALRRVGADVETRADAWVHRIQCAPPLPPLHSSPASCLQCASLKLARHIPGAAPRASDSTERQYHDDCRECRMATRQCFAHLLQ